MRYGSEPLRKYGTDLERVLFHFDALAAIAPATSYATLLSVAGGSTPAENNMVLTFADAADTYTDFRGRMPIWYANGGVTLRFFLGGASSSTNGCVVGAAFRRFQDNTENATASQTYDYNYGTFAMPATTGLFKQYSLAFTAGADMDSLAAGEDFILRVYRDGDGTNGTDNYASTMWMWRVYGVEL